MFVDHGLMRKDEGEQVIATFRDTFSVPLVAVDAERRFLERLRGSPSRGQAQGDRGRVHQVFEEERRSVCWFQARRSGGRWC